MNRIFCLSLAAASLLCSTAYADDIDNAQNSAIDATAVESEAAESEAAESEAAESEAAESEAVESEAVESAPSAVEIHSSVSTLRNHQLGWGPAIMVNVSAGPAADLRDPCFGYSASIGAGYHEKYWGVRVDVTWNTLWSTASANRPNHRHDFADETSNSGLMVLGHGYLPTSNRFVMLLGAGIGLGARYEYFNDAPEIRRKVMNVDPSWLFRIETGALWIVGDFLNTSDFFTIGFNMELNLGDYHLSKLPRWLSDDEMDISLGFILTVSYQSLVY